MNLRLRSSEIAAALTVALTAGLASLATADIYTLQSGFSGAQQVPPNGSNGSASLAGTYDSETNVLLYSIAYRLDSSATSVRFASLHAAGPGKSAPAAVALNTSAATGNSSYFTGVLHLNAETEAALKAGNAYFNIASDRFPDGELRGQISALASPTWAISLPITPEENSSVALDGATPRGYLTAGYYPASRRLTVAVYYKGLTRSTLEAHLHGPAERGEYGPRLFAFTNFPTGTEGVMVNRFSLTHTQASALENGLLYYCLKTARNPGGELRGQLMVGNVHCADSDVDGLGAEAESALGTNPTERDSDGDGIEDGVEVALTLDPTVPNSFSSLADIDHDLIPDSIDPDTTISDTDGDHFLDGYELAVGTDPNNAASRPRLGDVDNNGMVDSVDAVVGTALFLGISIPFPTYPERGDVNRDGKFDNVDVILLHQFCVGRVVTLPLT